MHIYPAQNRGKRSPRRQAWVRTGERTQWLIGIPGCAQDRVGRNPAPTAMRGAWSRGSSARECPMPYRSTEGVGLRGELYGIFFVPSSLCHFYEKSLVNIPHLLPLPQGEGAGSAPFHGLGCPSRPCVAVMNGYVLRQRIDSVGNRVEFTRYGS